jgi:hypothetical protein
MVSKHGLCHFGTALLCFDLCRCYVALISEAALTETLNSSALAEYFSDLGQHGPFRVIHRCFSESTRFFIMVETKSKAANKT